MQYIKKPLALIIAIVMLSILNVSVLANVMDNEHHWYYDSGPQSNLEFEAAFSAANPNKVIDFYLEDRYLLHSPAEISEIKFLTSIFGISKPIEGKKVTTAEGKTEWQTELQFSMTCPEDSWIKAYENNQIRDEEGNAVFSDECTISFKTDDSGNTPAPLTIPCNLFLGNVLSLDGDFAQQLPNGIIAPGRNGNELSIYLYDPIKGNSVIQKYEFIWTIEEGADCAGFTPAQNSKSDQLVSNQYVWTDKPGCWVNKVKIYAYKAGFASIKCQVKATEDGIAYGGDNISLTNVDVAVGFDSLDEDAVDNELKDIKEGKDVTLELPDNSGLNEDHFQKIKEAAQEGNANPIVTLKPKNDIGLDLSFKFAVEDIKENWNGIFNTFYQKEKPADAENQGFSNDGQWIKFAYSGDAPVANMKIRFKAPGNLQQYTLYFYDETTGKLTEAQTATIDENGYLEYVINHFSAYAVYPAGLNPNPSPNYTPSTGPQSSGGSGSGGGSSHSSSSTPSKGILNGSALGNINTSNATTAKTVGVTEAKNAATKAADQAKASGKTKSYVRFVNPTMLPKDVLDTVQKTAKQKGVDLSVYADTVANYIVTARMYIDPAAYTLTNDIKTGIIAGDTAIEAHFGKYFKNSLKVVKFDQQGAFGFNVGVAIKLDLRGFDTSKLVLYSYDVITNKYFLLSDQTYSIDANGYLHFTTSNGNYIIVSEGPLH